MRKLLLPVLGLVALTSFSGCETAGQNIALGAGLGAIAAVVLTDNDDDHHRRHHHQRVHQRPHYSYVRPSYNNGYSNSYSAYSHSRPHYNNPS